MLHARTDYARIQDPEGKIGEDEPVMLFRAQDVVFIPLLEFYVAQLEKRNASADIITAVKRHIGRAHRWRADRIAAGVDPVAKIPDIPPGTVL